MKLRYFCLLGLVFFAKALLAANVVVTFNADKTEATITYNGSTSDYCALQNSSQLGADYADVMAATKLTFVGYFQNLEVFQGGASVATSVDMSEAYFPETNHTVDIVYYTDDDLANPKTDQYTVLAPAENAPTFKYWSETLTEAIISNHIHSIQKSTFDGMKHLHSLTFPSNIEAILGYAIQNSYQDQESTTEDDDLGLKELNFPSTLKYIESYAFRQTTSIKNVYPESRSILCSYDAFDFKSDVQQTDIYGQSGCTLNLPSESSEDFEYFVGSWKAGMVFTQTELNALKDGDITKGQRARNGWQQFSHIGSSREIVIVGNLFKTYSDVTAHVVPKGIMGFRAQSYDNNDRIITLKSVTNKSDGTHNVIPANTGMILISTDAFHSTNSEPAKFWLGDATTAEAQTIRQYSYDASGDETLNNYLVGSLTSTVTVNAADWSGGSIGSGTVTYRNFALNKRNNVWRFVRSKNGSQCPPNKAYLKLPASIFPYENEGIDGGPTTNPGDSGIHDEDYTMVQGMIFLDLEDEMVTGISEAIRSYYAGSEIEDDNYYTISGVKVGTPTTKGIYIFKGKKIIFK